MPFSPPVLLKEDRIKLRRKQKEDFKRMKFMGYEFTKAHKTWFIYMVGFLWKFASKIQLLTTINDFFYIYGNFIG